MGLWSVYQYADDHEVCHNHAAEKRYAATLKLWLLISLVPVLEDTVLLELVLENKSLDI